MRHINKWTLFAAGACLLSLGPLSLGAACSKKADPPPDASAASGNTPSSTAAAGSSPKIDEAAAEAKPSGTEASPPGNNAEAAAKEAPTPEQAKAPEPKDAEPDEEWLLWADTPTGWRTRWVALTGDGFETLAEKDALIVSDGGRLWRIEFTETVVEMKPCACEDDPESEECKKVEKAKKPGLQAVSLPSGETTKLYGDNDGMVGDSYDATLGVVAGDGARLFVEWAESGFFCGAHGSNSGGTKAYDVGRGSELELDWKGLKAALPAEVLKKGAEETHRNKAECDLEEAGTVEDVKESMTLSSLRASAGDDGSIIIHWGFESDVPYACSADYAARGDALSGLVEGLKIVGLSASLPPGVLKAMASVAGAHRVGWSKLQVKGETRQKTLEAFR